MNYQAYETIEKHLCKEVDMIADNINRTNNISIQDIEKLDKIYHTLKSMATFKAMKEAEDYSEENQNEGISGRRSMGHMPGKSYADGYNRGYSDASGHYPMPYYEPRRW